MDHTNETNSLQHHGIKGMKWGVRRYQNKDGSLTPLGEKRMGVKSGVDKKLREDLKDRRVARRMNIQKQRQAMMQDTLDRMNARRLDRAKVKLAQQKAQEEAADSATNRKLAKDKLKSDEKLAKDKLKLEEKDQKQDALDRETNRKIAKQKMKLEVDAAKNKDQQTLPAEEYYELPDTPSRQQASGANGKKIAGAALAAVGTVALMAVAKKYGPEIISKIGKSKIANMAKDAAKDASNNADAYKDFASEIYKEASKYKGMTRGTNAIAEGSSTPLLAAPQKSTPNIFASVLDGLKDVKYYGGS